ncbi:MAG: hypothetical protein J6P16_03835, partial [Eubacterium sp.]|nr:hypothetical protein [Eubacterium sp.]
VFSSSDTKIARVNSSGTVIPVSPGVAVITARCGGQESICFVTVTKNVNYLGHNPGQEKALRAFIKKAAASGADISTDTDDSCYKWDEDGYLKLVFFDDIGLKGNLDFSAFTRLNTIYMYDCPDVTGIDVTGCEKLKILHIYQYDDRGSIKNIDLSGNKILEHLVLDKQEIGEIDLSHNSELKFISFSGLPATSIDTGKNTKLESYMLEDMNIDSLDISGNKALKQLCLTNCEIKNTDTIDVRGYASLEKMTLEGLSWLNKLYVSGCEKLTRVIATKTGLTELDFTGCKAYEGFDPYDFGGSGIKRLKFNGCSSMKEFSYASNFTHTELESVDLSGCTGLTELSLPSRLFSTVDIRSFHNLRKIDIDSLPAGIITPGKYDGQYEGDIDLSGLGELREVFISGNHIKNLKLTGVRKLKRLKAINCGIESIVFDPAGHPMLTILETNLNDLKEFIAPDLPALRTVYLSGNNNLSTIDLSGAPSLKSLSTDPIGGALKSIVLNSALKDSAELSLTPKRIKEIITYK